MSENEIVHIGQQPTSLAIAGDGIDEMFTLKPQNMELVQNTTRAEGAQPGKFRVTQSNDHFDQIEFVILKARRGRVLFPPGDFGGDTLCRSFDGLVPAENVVAPPSSKCGNYVNGKFKAICPKASWGADKKKPECAATLSLLIVEKTTRVPYYISFKRTALPPIENLMQSLAARFQASRAAGETPNIYDYAVTLKASKVSNASQVYFVPTVLGYKKLEAATAAEFGGLFQEYVVRQKADAEAARAEEAVSQQMNPAVVAQAVNVEAGVAIDA
jgi:hypothetical protein